MKDFMNETFQFQLGQISDIWNYYILKYKCCSDKLNLKDAIETNYFGDILGYFSDVVDIVFVTKPKVSSFEEKFAFTISFLQALYVQQDFVEEMLSLFQTKYNKMHLKDDPLYSTNRNVRNEIVGHPIRKLQGKFISSTLFSYETSATKLQYLRYHKDNNFKFEIMSFRILDIQNRHRLFLEKYFTIILSKLKTVVNRYIKELGNLEMVLEKGDFQNILKLTRVYFEDIFGSDFLYNEESLLKIYNRKEEHFRYLNLINRFIQDLKESIDEKKNFAQEIFLEKPESMIDSPDLPKIEIVFVKAGEDAINKAPIKESYHYEIGKLATKRDPRDFEFFGGILRRKCADNKVVMEEMDHMEAHLWNDIEYYSALRLICLELKEE
ncbi:hypothetical protein ACS5PU_08750 [Pedobacter sp. GSP4]|uniref:hypothetical protein n=1 Tax=Pedobacter sp. GSP4 TaxID=3453716 RepID=UPI003EEF694B